jgi:uncharacterized protein (TIGR02453 family)
MQDIFSFLVDLSRNNNRDWFTEHKKRYQEALEQFRVFAYDLHQGLLSFDPSLGTMDPKDSIFRIYKDIRFSKDKTPYKTHFGCWMTRGGRKSTDAGYYFHMEPGGSFMAAGSYAPPSEQLNLIRQEIVFNPADYLKIMEDQELRARFERHGNEDKLKKGPAGFPKDFDTWKRSSISTTYYPDLILTQRLKRRILLPRLQRTTVPCTPWSSTSIMPCPLPATSSPFMCD